MEQFLHAFTSRGFDSVSWAFLYSINKVKRSVLTTNDGHTRGIAFFDAVKVQKATKSRNLLQMSASVTELTLKVLRQRVQLTTYDVCM